MIKQYTDRVEVLRAVVEVSLRSASAKEINIFELGTLNDLLSREEAELIRAEFVRRDTPIKQITNLRKFTSWTDNPDLVQQNLSVKYISPENFDIKNEILIFDDTTAIYRLRPDPFYLEVHDKFYTSSMRNFFVNAWQTGDALLLSEDGSTLTKQYLPLSFCFGEVPVVAYPAKDDGRLEKVFSRNNPGVIENYIHTILDNENDFYNEADMILAYVWNEGETPCCDIWKITRNDISDDSGFLYDARIYENMTQTTDLGVASGNSSIVLAAEEMLLRQLILVENHSFTEAADRIRYSARFPIGYVPDEFFYLSGRA
jgi:hypothetical protein